MTRISSNVATADPLIRAAGGVVAAIGVVFLLVIYSLFATPHREMALTFGLFGDICGAIQYFLTIPIVVALYWILFPYNPALIRVATWFGIAMLLTTSGLQLALIFRLLTFAQEEGWATLAIIVGIGTWFLITGLVTPSTGRMPNSVPISAVAAPDLGYPIWAFWPGRLLLNR